MWRNGCKIWVLAAAALSVPIPALADDAVKAEGLKYSDGVTVIGIANGKLLTQIKGKERSFDLAKIDWLYLENQPIFNKAEDSRKDAKAAASLYKSCIPNFNDPKLKVVAEMRAVAPLDADSRYADAVSFFLDVYQDSPTESVWNLRPKNIPPATSSVLKESAVKIEGCVNQFFSTDARRNLKTWELEMLTKANDPTRADLERQLGPKDISGVGADSTIGTPRATPPGGLGDLYPRVRPSYVSAAAAAASDITSPLATAKEEKLFHDTFDSILQDADKGSAEDRAAAAELLDRRAAGTGVSEGTKRLLLLAAFDLAKRVNAAPADLAARATAVLAALAGTSVALVSRRIVIRSEMNQVAPRSIGFSRTDVADEIFLLAELRYNLGLFQDAADDLKTADQWSAHNPAYTERMKARVQQFSAEVQQQLAIANKLAASPDDPDANTQKGLSMLSRSGNAVDAAPFLAKSGQAELRKLAKAMLAPRMDTATRLDVATAAGEALAVVNGDAQLGLAYLLQSQAVLVAKDRAASEAQKAKAELLLIKAEKLVGKAKMEDASQVPVEKVRQTKFFGLETQGHKIVYILDHSGSMLDTFDFLRKETVRSVSKLEPEQSFSVVMVSEQASVIFPRLERATPDIKQEFASKLSNFRAQGMNDDLLAPFKEAFQKAFDLQPEVIYFLTDGHFDPRLTEVVENLNKSKRVRVNTLAFVNPDPSYEDQLKDMAKKHGGVYRFVSEKDLGK